ncbi:MAG: pyruvate kinase [Fimbriimonadaceae bacterium]|nr:pyruvate kinase [Alphaproteobacteria bacterium]
MKRDRKVKILATLGPATSSPTGISELFDAGTDVFRINMSHTSHDELKRLVEDIRTVEAEKQRPIGVLVDLQGPKLRIGRIANGPIDLAPGDIFTLDTDETPGNQSRAHLPHPEIFSAIEVGHDLLLDDGRIRMKVRSVTADRIETEVVVASPISSRKGVSLPDTLLPMAAMTNKDRKDLEYALNLDISWVALSFVQRPEDVAEAKKIARGRAAVMAKMEKPSAIRFLDEILDISDGIMVARGDLGVELPVEQVPGLQKRMTRAARRAGKPVVIATQMLESMISAPVPTRAEVSDVATAVFEGVDAIMLSAESAVGEYPAEAVRTMDRIAREVENDSTYQTIIDAQKPEAEATGADAISAALNQIANTLKLAAIVCYTSSGTTGLRAARQRPARPLITLTPNPQTGRRLALVWGLHCVLTDDAKDVDDMVNRACRISFQEGFAKPGERIIISAGVPFGTPGATNILRIAFVGDENMDGF